MEDKGLADELKLRLKDCQARREELSIRVRELEAQTEKEFVVAESDLYRRAVGLAENALHRKDPDAWAQFFPRWQAMVNQFYAALREETNDAG